MRHVCVPIVPRKDERIHITGPESHHLTNVLRCRVGEVLRLFDGRGHSNMGEIVEIDKGRVSVIGVDNIQSDLASTQRHLCMAQTKQKALDLAIRACTEVGVTHLNIFCAERSVNRAQRLDRWTRIATAAAKQCGRSEIPTLGWFASLRELMDALEPQVTQRFIASQSGEFMERDSSPAAILIGPEGGFTDTELSTAQQAGFKPVGLAHWTLRADTAAILAAAFICSDS